MSDDLIRVVPATHDVATGEKLEPEERPAAVVSPMRVPLTLGLPTQVQQIPVAPLTVRSETTYELTAGELAASLRKRCATCAHFDRLGWHKLKREYEHSSRMEHRQFLHDIRATVAAVISTEGETDLVGDLEELEVERALLDCGICRAISEIFTKYTPDDPYFMVVASMAGCPDQTKGPAGEDLSQLYKPRDRAAARAAGQAQDVILRMAMGKEPERR